MNKARAREAIDKAADDDIAKLFDILRGNELGEGRNVALEQYTAGIKRLQQDIVDAKAIIDAVFPD